MDPLEPVAPWTEEDWRVLLRRIAEPKTGVIPVIGPDLVQVEGTPLSKYLACELAGRLGVKEPEADDSIPLDAVIWSGRQSGRSRANCIEELCELVRTLDLPVPEPLRQLADMEHFALFVTTAFDPLLVRALTESRGKVPRTIAYGRAEKPDLDRDLPSLRREGECVVFQLLGEPGFTPGTWAVTEEDKLEFHHLLQSETRRPPLLFSELKNRHLLLLGGGIQIGYGVSSCAICGGILFRISETRRNS